MQLSGFLRITVKFHTGLVSSLYPNGEVIKALLASSLLQESIQFLCKLMDSSGIRLERNIASDNKTGLKNHCSLKKKKVKHN